MRINGCKNIFLAEFHILVEKSILRWYIICIHAKYEENQWNIVKYDLWTPKSRVIILKNIFLTEFHIFVEKSILSL